jgi:hypothetical protein
MTTVSTRTGLPSAYSTRDLALAVRAQPLERAVPAGLGEAHRELVRERDRERHELLGLADREAEHEALVAGSARVDAHRDVGRLLVDRRDHGARLEVEPVLGARVADVLDRLPHDARDVDVGLRRDLARDEGEARRDERLARDAAHRVVRQDGVQDRVRDLVGDLVGMPLGDGLGREEMTVLAHGCLPAACGERADVNRREISHGR